MKQAIILAGGYGSRLGEITKKTPKPALMVKGKPLICHVVDYLASYGLKEIYIKLFYKASQIEKVIGEREVDFIWEKVLSGTAGFLKKHEDILDDNFLVVNGDTITNLDLKDFIDFHYKFGNIAAIYTQDTARHCGGIYAFKKSVVKYIKSNSEMIDKDLIPTLEKNNIPISLYFDDRAFYFDCNTKEKLDKANKLKI